jgi:uncharacterized membrane protein YkoI
MKEKLNNRYYKPKDEDERNEIIRIYKANGIEINGHKPDRVNHIECFTNKGKPTVLRLETNQLDPTSSLTTIEELRELVREPATIAQTCETKQKLTTQGMFDEIIKGEFKDAERINEIWKEAESPEETMKREFGNRYATVTVRHGLNTYTGKRKLKTPEGMAEVKDTIEACSSGKAASFRLETEDGFVYFPAQILKKCVFSLVVEN